MKIIARIALTIGAAALLAACSGSEPPTGALGATPESVGEGLPHLTSTLAQRALRRSDTIQYISENSNYGNALLEFDYPKGESSVGSIAGYSGGLCTKGARTFWVATGAEAAEFKVGGTTPIRVLKPAGGACSIALTSGDLASITSSGVIIFRHAHGKGKAYGGTGLSEAFFEGYDGRGNLFLDGFNSNNAVELVELPRGDSSFRTITTSNTIEFPGSIQWDGAYLTVFDQLANAFYRYTISGTTATLEGTISLNGSSDCASTWIAQPYVYCADAGNDNGEVFKYPVGGSRIAILTAPFDFPMDVVSVRLR